MTRKPSKLVVVIVDERPKPKADPVTTHHAATPGSGRSLCGRHDGLAAVTGYRESQTGVIVDPEGNESPISEPWPKHWPSTDRRQVCQACVNAAELMWRRVDREPNVDLLNASSILKRLAAALTPALAEAKEALAAVGFPGAGSPGSGGIADDTGYFAATATDLTDWIDAVRDVKGEVMSGVFELQRLIAIKSPKVAEPITTCGDVQRSMSADDRAGWTIDEQCGRMSVRSNGLCDRCGKRHDEAKRAAA